MEGSNPPQLPAPITFAGAKNEYDGLTRLVATGADSESGDRVEEGAGAAPVQPISLEEFKAAIATGMSTEADVDSQGQSTGAEARTLLRLRFEAPLSNLSGVCRSIVEAHCPEFGVAADGDDQVLMVLPEGVSWSSVVQTVCRVEPMLGQRVTAGLAEFAEAPEALERAIELSELGATRAAAAGQPACMLDLDTLIAEEERMRQEAQVAAALLASLRSGTGLRLVYQPKYDLKTNELVGAEALLRLECEELGALGPSEFLPIAERAGLRSQVERWVLDAGIAAIADWQHEGVLPFPVSLNVEPTDFFSENFVDEMKQWIEVFKADPSLVRLELPERGLASHSSEAVHDRLRAIRALGVTVALDDVGESDAQLAGIRGLEIDALKVHRSLVLEMAFCKSTSVVVRGILSLARALDIQTVAAGVETESQLSQLREFGCSVVQGYLLSRPLEEDAFGALLRSQK